MCVCLFKGHNVPRPGCVNASTTPLNTKTYDRDSSKWLKENSETSLVYLVVHEMGGGL